MNVTAFLRKNRLLTVVALSYIALAILMPRQALLAAKNSLYYVFEMLMIMPVIFILTALLEGWVPKQTIINGFGKNAGFRGNILAFLLGSFSAGPIYAAFPVCKALLGKGASIMNIVIVLSTWAVVKAPMLANEARFLGPDFMLLRWALTTVAIFIMGFIVSRQVNESDLPIEDHSKKAAGIHFDQEYCIGCSLCARQCPQAVVMKDGKAHIKLGTLAAESAARLRDVAKRCPGKAIVCDECQAE